MGGRGLRSPFYQVPGDAAAGGIIPAGSPLRPSVHISLGVLVGGGGGQRTLAAPQPKRGLAAGDQPVCPFPAPVPALSRAACGPTDTVDYHIITRRLALR